MKQNYQGGTHRYCLRLSDHELFLLKTYAKVYTQGNINAAANRIISAACHDLQTERVSLGYYLNSDCRTYHPEGRHNQVNLRVQRQNFEYLRFNQIDLPAVVREGLK